MTVHLAVAVRNTMSNDVKTAIDAGAGPGTIKIYTGSQPANGDATATGTLLATVTLADPSFGSSSSGTITGTDPASVNAVATGTAGWFRVQDSTGANVFDGAVTAAGGGGDMTLSSISITSGGPVDITSLTYTTPA